MTADEEPDRARVLHAAGEAFAGGELAVAALEVVADVS